MLLSKHTAEELKCRLPAKMQVKTPGGMLFYTLKNHLLRIDFPDNIK